MKRLPGRVAAAHTYPMMAPVKLFAAETSYGF
jgi:hypothetical protein